MRVLQGLAGFLVAVLLACGGGGGGGGGTKCSDGLTACLGACVDLQTEAAHCGACGHACGLGTCQAGGCVCASAPVQSCGATVSPECANLASDPANCGTCGHACATEKPGSTCSGGSCQCLDARPDDCGSRCTDRQTDAANCGTCGHACPLTNDVCVGGACQCPTDKQDVCGSSPGTCVSLATDEQNCGTCGHACATGATCTARVCQCPALKVPCGATSSSPGKCVDTTTDTANCGGCGNVCPAGATCAGTCACPTGETQICGRTGTAAGQCCAGTGCCSGGACQTAHPNGLGQTYYDCTSLGTHTADQAIAAAQAWSSSGPVVDAPNCLSCKCTSTASQAAVFCYEGSSVSGLVAVSAIGSCAAALCPIPGDATTFEWR
jgi:hypothetical protein